MASRAALCGEKEVLVFDLHGGLSVIPIPTVVEAERSRDPNHSHSGTVLVTRCSPSGRFLVAVDDSKRVVIFDLTDLACPRLLSEFSVPRRASSCAFSATEDAVLIADKSGDVFRTSLVPPFAPPDLLLGHLSIVTDLQMSPTGRLLASADRDEKVRLSHFPNCYSIAAFLLAHRSFVSRIAFSPCGSYLCSAGGDGALILWHSSGGRCLARCDLRAQVGAAAPNGLHWMGRRLLLSFEGSPKVLTVDVDPEVPSISICGELELGAAVRASFALDSSLLLLTDSGEERLVLLREEDGVMRRADVPTISEANRNAKERLSITVRLCTPLEPLKKNPVDKTGLEAYSERKEQIQKNVLARRTRHQHLKAKRQRQRND